MNDLSVFMDTTAHRPPSRILFKASFTADLQRRLVQHTGQENLAEHYGFFQPAGLPLRRPAGVAPPDYRPYWRNRDLPPGTSFDGYGVAMVPSGFYHFWGYVSPLAEATSLSDIENYPLDDLATWDFSHMAGISERAHARGHVVSGHVGHMYETAWQIRGYEQFLMDLIERPAWAECLLERLFMQNMVKATAFARHGADLIHCGDDVANQQSLMFSPETWQRFMLSRWRQVWHAIKAINPDARIWYHSDGNITQIIPDLLDAGVDILNPLQPECLDFDAIYRQYHRRVTFDGLIGTQSTMPFGTPDQVRARVAQVIEKYGQHGGLIVSPTHVLEPEVPIANIEAYATACREFGRL